MPRIIKALEPIPLTSGHRVIMRKPRTIPRVQLAKDLPTIMGLIFNREVGEDAVVPIAEIEAAIDFLSAPPLSPPVRAGYALLHQAAAATLPERIRLADPVGYQCPLNSAGDVDKGVLRLTL